MDDISVGVIHTNSSILPMSKLFNKALNKVFKSQSEIDVEVYPEFVGQGGLRQVEEAVSKMINFHDVDVVTGIVSSKVVMELADKFKDKDILFLPNNLGEQILDPQKVSDNIYLNSTLLWQQLWSLGHWATKKFGSKGMFAGGVYDMAYSFTHVLDLGMRAADPDCKWSFAVSHMPEEGETLSDPSVIFDYVEEEMPDFLFVAFCGKEATLFLDEFISRGLHEKIPVVTTPYLLEDYNQTLAEPLRLYTTLAAGKPLTDQDLLQDWTSPSGIFSAMGRDSARMILKAASDNQITQIPTPFDTERGSLPLAPKALGKGSQVCIVENTHSGEKATIERQIIEQVATIDIDDPGILDGLKNLETSWQNPYLGV